MSVRPPHFALIGCFGVKIPLYYSESENNFFLWSLSLPNANKCKQQIGFFYELIRSDVAFALIEMNPYVMLKNDQVMTNPQRSGVPQVILNKLVSYYLHS